MYDTSYPEFECLKLGTASNEIILQSIDFPLLTRCHFRLCTKRQFVFIGAKLYFSQTPQLNLLAQISAEKLATRLSKL